MTMNQGQPKILYLITKANFGGAQRAVFNLAKEARHRGWNVAVALGPKGALTEKLEAEHIRTLTIPSLGRDINIADDIRSFFELVKIFQKEKPDIVHLHSSKIGGLGALAARIAGIPKIVFTAHGWPFLEELPPLNIALRKFFSWLTILLSTQVIDISETTREKALSFPGARKKLYLIYNGIDPKTQFLPHDLARERLAQAIGKSPAFLEGKTIIGTISELHANKGLDHLIAALHKIKHLPFVCIIIGEGEKREEIESQITQLGLEEKVFLPGFIPDAEHYLPAFDIFTLTSRKEGFPFALLEAGIAELPTLASPVGGIPELIREENGVLVHTGDTQKIADALETLIKNPLAREILGKNLKETVAREFTLEAMLENTFNLYTHNPHPATVRGALALLQNVDGRFLLSKRDHFTKSLSGQWCAIGGAIEPGEAPQEALAREVREETNLSITGVHLLEKVTRADAENMLFYARVNTETDELRIAEGSELRLFTAPELKAHIENLPYSNPFLKAILRHLPHLS